MTPSNHCLDWFFHPNVVAVVGATNNPLKMNYRLLQNLLNLEFDGKIYPVNHKGGKTLGIKTFPRLQDIPDLVDLAVIAVTAQKVPGIIKDCVDAKIRNAVIITGGFSEGGEKGMALQEEIKTLISKNCIRVLGPNTLSPVNTANQLAISFHPIRKLNRGKVSFAFQSGFYEPMINWIFSYLGINKMLDMGNKIDIHEMDALEYYSRDPGTGIIAMHIESLHCNARKFLRLMKDVTRKKPVIVLKVGKTPAGSRAAASHTGTMAIENDAVFDGALRQAGAIRARNLEEFFDLVKAFQFLSIPQGNRLSIITMSGGEGVMATDSSQTYGLTQAGFENRTRQILSRISPDWEIPLNPFDAGVCMEFHLSDLTVFFDALMAIPEDKNVDCTIMQLFPWTLSESEEIPEKLTGKADSIKDLYVQRMVQMRKAGKPLALWCTSSGHDEMQLIQRLESARIPVFRSSERAVKALSAMHRYHSMVSQRR
ncbi:hypothetical protein DSCA_19330 [Desulfosarcina alkanivorans]|uniref:CoA-binding domain-containing protein n=1 Tax=Desulfosarcina alkanivorans TaxID=571177 RepID=A0A5K7YHG2_9BACT|nr:CoA-binding protein [Desulfosarcina alkanivorans]BBO68003.1 hypothetical protein DSCA_19330 [Desulfosarcina alkanivorans]